MELATSPHSHEPESLRFHDLMHFLVHEILVVSSDYDAYVLEEDGHLGERLFSAYAELSLSSPRITHVPSAREALELLATRRFDLVITVVRLEDTDAAGLAKSVKEAYPDLPVVLLAFDEADLDHFPQGQPPSTIDRVFLWTGDAQILVAAIKLIEDARNVAVDARAGVQVIIVVEDQLRRYSSFLSLLYTELLRQSRSLVAEGQNVLHRITRMRARPRVLLATSFEGALDCYREFQDNVLAVISDLRFPRDGAEDPEAGFELVKRIRAETPEVPILLQSAQPESEVRARALGVWYAHKTSTTLLEQIRGFLKEALGFGDFVFRLPDYTEIARARDLYELSRLLRTVPEASLEYHGSHNHFSIWLNARGKFALARQVRPRSVSDFKNNEEIRRYLLDLLERELAHEQDGLIADYTAESSGPERRLVRLGGGSIGGKGRGLAFVNSMLARRQLRRRFPGIEIRVPRTIALGAEEFDRFLEDNAWTRESLLGADERAITARFLEGQMRDSTLKDLKRLFQDFHGPVAVRSSSLLEDSRSQPFAGIYATILLPNNDPDPQVRLRELRQAIKAVYASTFSRDAQSYFSGAPHSLEEEKMAVLIQEVVGRNYGERFYPQVSGVAQSHNYYPVGPQRAEDGVCMLALGLGHAVVTGGRSLRFSPACPAVLPQFASPRDFLRGSQSSFYALDLTRPTVDYHGGPESSLGLYGLDAAEADGSLSHMGSVYCAEDDAIRDTLNLSGPRVLTFNNILKWNEVPLADTLRQLLQMFRQWMGGHVEIEFAMNLDGEEGEDGRMPILYLLQVRPMATLEYVTDPCDPGTYPRPALLCRTSRALGHGRIDGIRDVVYVKRIAMDAYVTRGVAQQVGRLAEGLRHERAPFLLVGPGRWGTQDPALGIPVEWSQIAGVRAIVETAAEGRAVEPSQGTHFLQNITSLRIGYLTVGRAKSDGEDFFDRDWLDAQRALSETEAVRHVRLAQPLKIFLDGHRGRALVVKPEPPAAEA